MIGFIAFAQEWSAQHPANFGQHTTKSERNTTIFRTLKGRHTELCTGLTYDHNAVVYPEKCENDCIINEDS